MFKSSADTFVHSGGSFIPCIISLLLHLLLHVFLQTFLKLNPNLGDNSFIIDESVLHISTLNPFLSLEKLSINSQSKLISWLISISLEVSFNRVSNCSYISVPSAVSNIFCCNSSADISIHSEGSIVVVDALVVYALLVDALVVEGGIDTSGFTITVTLVLFFFLSFSKSTRICSSFSIFFSASVFSVLFLLNFLIRFPILFSEIIPLSSLLSYRNLFFSSV